MTIELLPVSSLEFEAFVEAFNLAYSDYFVPMQLSVDHMAGLIEREAIKLDLSLAAVVNDRIVGMGMLGIRGKDGWVGGMGTIPEYRRQGIARKVLTNLLGNARRNGLAHVDLEVITQNRIAYNLYEDLGFEKVRTLVILSRPPSDHMLDHKIEGFTLRPASVSSVLAYCDVFHNMHTPWQRSLGKMQSLATQLDARVITSDAHQQTILGYAIGTFHERHIQYWDAAINPNIENRRAVAMALLVLMHRTLPKASGAFLNLSEEEIMLQPMQSLGYRQTLRQYEMRFTF